MKLLLDSHLLVWLAETAALLRPAELEALVAADEVAVSAVSIWELRLKWERRFESGDRKGPRDPGDLLRWVQQNDLRLIDLTPASAVADLDPPLPHSDPFDVLLLIQAQQGGYRLLTRDRQLAQHPVALTP